MAKKDWIVPTAIVLAASALLIAGYLFAPKTDTYPGAVTKESGITYRIGEKVMVRPDSTEWYDGTIKAITSEDDYVVEYCGPFDWFNKWMCLTDQLRRSQLAKVEQGESE
ncbi:tudor domain-containing protein [Streptomyces cinereoruber]|uniref:hypothetical protein n=1 Tax=Streptomyces cinereoruber TaxID=67260 RepID=UPI00362FE49C